MTPPIARKCPKCHQPDLSQYAISQSEESVCDLCKKITQRHENIETSLSDRNVQPTDNDDSLFDTGLILSVLRIFCTYLFIPINE